MPPQTTKTKREHHAASVRIIPVTFSQPLMPQVVPIIFRLPQRRRRALKYRLGPLSLSPRIAATDLVPVGLRRPVRSGLCRVDYQISIFAGESQKPFSEE